MAFCGISNSCTDPYVSFHSVLHNPHLGLTDTLHRLYDLAKKFADTVVPQEYGTTISEKRSVGLKICHGLLEKIKFDLGYSRQDKNQADIRYMVSAETWVRPTITQLSNSSCFFRSTWTIQRIYQSTQWGGGFVLACTSLLNPIFIPF